MRRREFITLFSSTVVTWSLTARAQQPDRMRRLGVLISGAAEADAEGQARVAALRLGLLEHGWVEGRNLEFITGGAVLTPAECGSMRQNWSV
jgi:putative tryptophan/tyrosine transport system substrate-binding protein